MSRLAWRRKGGEGGNVDPVDADILTAAILTGHRPNLRRTVAYVSPFHWAWEIVDHARSPHPVLASGAALTEAQAWRRVEEAHGLLVDAIRRAREDGAA